MLEFKIFLGSSFKLMETRKKLGNMIRLLNDNWLKKGVRIKLYIWEDYTIGYSGKHKQQEYIDNMVLPSDFCVFMFSQRVGKYTKMELEAKLKQDRNSVVCYRLPFKGKFKEAVKNELESIGTTYIDVNADDILCEKVQRLIEERLNKIPNTTPRKLNELYFYTTIPDDLSEYRSSIGTAIRNFDDATMDEWGIHCVLHPMNRIHLLDDTDHYIPILLKDVGKNDFIELKAGLERAKDSRIKRMTVFDRGKIYKDNEQVRSLLDGSGVYTDKIADLEGLKWKLHEWLRKTKNTLFCPNDLSIKNNSVTINNIPVASVSSINNSGVLRNLITQIENQEKDVSQTLNNDSRNDLKISNGVTDIKLKKAYLGLELSLVLNEWTNELVQSDSIYQETVRKCLETDNVVRGLLKGPISIEIATQIKDLLLTKEELEMKLVNDGLYSPLLLLNTQLTLVGLLDSFFTKESDYRETEDSLFIRIVNCVDKVGLINDYAEMIRMNLGNMYNHNENYEEADKIYRKAIENLKKLGDHSVRVERLITIVYTHLFHLELETGCRNSSDTLVEFKKHVTGLDNNESFLIDRCMYSTAELTQIDIDDNSSYGIVESAIHLYEEAKNYHLINDVRSDAFFDVMVYLPHMIARYHIDHLPESSNEQTKEFSKKAETYLNEAYDNCERVRIKDDMSAMFVLGEIEHNRGFLYSKIYRLRDSGKAYLKAYDWRCRYYNIYKEPSSERRIAETLVNIGALEQMSMSNGHPTIDQLKVSLSKVKQALNIYQRHLSNENPNGELEFYQALQLKATILDLIVRENPENILAYNEAMLDYFNCWTWNKKHPNNQYRRKFISISGSILRERNFITEEEFETVKKEMGI